MLMPNVTNTGPIEPLEEIEAVEGQRSCLPRSMIEGHTY